MKRTLASGLPLTIAALLPLLLLQPETSIARTVAAAAPLPAAAHLAAPLAAAAAPREPARPAVEMALPAVEMALSLPGPVAPAEAGGLSADPALSAALRALKPGQAVQRSEAQAETLQSLYRSNGLRPLWIRGAQPGPSVETVRAALATAGLHGLDPEDYRVRWIEGRLAALGAGTLPMSPGELAQIDITLTLALLRYLADVHDGRALTRQISGVWVQSPSLPDVSILLDAVPDPAKVQALIAAAAPAYPSYGRLLAARARYATLVAAEREMPKVRFAAKIEPGDESELTPLIAARLIELGDLSGSGDLTGSGDVTGAKDPVGSNGVGAPAGQRYQGAVVDAVRRFQWRHGLAVDGVVGKGTWSALQTPHRQRLRQIDLALERLRWLPPLVADRVIAVNIPEFMLRAYAPDAVEGGRMKLVLQSRVVVGRQGRTPTPVFIANLSAIDFSPYWNVPFSIASGEILPRLRRDPGYLARQQMEFVAADGRTISREVSQANLAAVARGAMRIRQTPGAHNALGNVKFTMPNAMNIYLHDTPSRSLFSESRRDFSHGCIRVEEPGRLAGFVLAADPAWDEAAIGQAMQGGELRVVKLPGRIPVVVFYTTVVADDDGTVRFLPDIYGYDRKLDAAMPASP